MREAASTLSRRGCRDRLEGVPSLKARSLIALGSCRVHHGADVVHPRLEGRQIHRTSTSTGTRHSSHRPPTRGEASPQVRLGLGPSWKGDGLGARRGTSEDQLDDRRTSGHLFTLERLAELGPFEVAPRRLDGRKTSGPTPAVAASMPTPRRARPPRRSSAILPPAARPGRGPAIC
jgi:hypothetical protein